MKLNRREFLRMTGITGALAALGIELPQMEIPKVSAKPLPVAAPSQVRASNASHELIDLSNLCIMCGAVSWGPVESSYAWSGDVGTFWRGPQPWEISASGLESEFNRAGFSIEDLENLLGQPRRYRFSKSEGDRYHRYFEGDGSLIRLIYAEGTIAVEVRGIGPLLEISA